LQHQTARIVDDRAALLAELSRLPGVQVWPSEANFLLCRVSGDARSVFEAVRAQGVLIKCLHGAHPSLANCLRVTVGTPEQNARLVDALRVSL
jgi:histidinol-phosphate aminotransferase